MLPRDITQRRVLDWSGRDVGKVVGLSASGSGWLFVRLDDDARRHHAADGPVVAVHVDNVSALRPGEVSLHVTLDRLLRSSARIPGAR